jgi:hypothetical protein
MRIASLETAGEDAMAQLNRIHKIYVCLCWRLFQNWICAFSLFFFTSFSNGDFSYQSRLPSLPTSISVKTTAYLCHGERSPNAPELEKGREAESNHPDICPCPCRAREFYPDRRELFIHSKQLRMQMNRREFPELHGQKCILGILRLALIPASPEARAVRRKTRDNSHFHPRAALGLNVLCQASSTLGLPEKSILRIVSLPF